MRRDCRKLARLDSFGGGNQHPPRLDDASHLLDRPAMRLLLAFGLMTLSGCCLSVTSGNDFSTGTASSSSTGGTTRGTASGSTGGSGGSPTGGTAGAAPGPCGLGSFWVGDTCVEDCETPIFPELSEAACLIADGGFGVCSTGRCIVLDDPLNCGRPGLVCPDGFLCVLSTCEYPEGNEGYRPVECATAPPASNCADTGLECLIDVGCVRAACGPDDDDLACNANESAGFCCGGVCHVADSDTSNCGGCGIVCGTGSACFNGLCLLAEPCGGIAEAFDTAICALPEGGGGTCCAGGCVDSARDPNNCGACGAICPTGATCDAGVCSQSCAGSCPEGYSCSGDACLHTDCTGAADGLGCAPDLSWTLPGTCCGGNCVDLGTDANNCGNCGAGCGDGAFCALYACSSYTNCATGDSPRSRCILEDGDAGACCSGTCGSAYCTDSEYCSLGDGASGLVCNGACIDPAQDPSNCGSCGNACASGICANDVCLPGGPSGDCGQTCTAGENCLGGQCLSAVCRLSPFAAFCSAEDGTIGLCCPATGACAHPRDDAENCGSCGNSCGPGGMCIDGSCTNMPGCGLGRLRAACNLDAGTGADFCCPSAGCIDTSSNPDHCGQFCAQCIRGQTCVNGECQ